MAASYLVRNSNIHFQNRAGTRPIPSQLYCPHPFSGLVQYMACAVILWGSANVFVMLHAAVPQLKSAVCSLSQGAVAVWKAWDCMPQLAHAGQTQLSAVSVPGAQVRSHHKCLLPTLLTESLHPHTAHHPWTRTCCADNRAQLLT